ncbi:hypothetical protein ACHAXT_001880 [Thalassiosira profunda]
MVFQKKSSFADAAYVDTTAYYQRCVPAATTNKAELQMLIDYFAIFDGSPEAAQRFQQAFQETFHPDLLVELPGSDSLDYAAAVACIQAGLNNGSRADLLSISENPDGTAAMTIRNNVSGLKDDVTRQLVSFKDGKVIAVHAHPDDAAQFGKMVSHYQRCVPTATTNKAEIKQLIDYFSIFDGSPEAAQRFQQAFGATFHPDLLVELPGSDGLDYAAAVACIQAGLNEGSRADLLSISENPDGTATMTICNNVAGLKGDVTRQVVSFKDGKVIAVHAHPDDAANFKNMVSHYQRCVSSAANRYSDMIACFDGSPDAFAKARPIIDDLMAPEMTISLGDGPKDLAWFLEWATAFGKQLNVAKIESIEPTANGFRVVIRNTVRGVIQDPVAQLGTVKDGKIIHWTADTGNEAGLDRLATSVAAEQDGMAGNIQRLKDYLKALDGSPDAFSRFEPHIDRVLSKNITWENDEGAKLNYDEVIELIRDRYIPNGCYPTLESVEVNDDGRSLTVVINNHLPGEDGDVTRQVLYYGDDDRIYRLLSSGLYSTFQRVGALPTK